MKKIVLGIIAILVLSCCIVFIAIGNEQYSKQQESLKLEQEQLFNQELREVQIPEEWYKQDGFDSITEWWGAIIERKQQCSNIATELVANLGDFLTDDEKKSISEYSEKIQNAHSINEINACVWSIESIETQAVERKNAASAISAENFKSAGVINANGYRYTWYSTNEGSAGYVPGIPGRYTGADGIIRDENNYIVVASSTHSKGTIVPTPFGEGKVYDTGCLPGTIDIYTEF